MTREEMIEADLNAAIADFPVDFVWAGDTYTGHFSMLTKSKRLEIGGFAQDVDGTIYTAKGQFSGPLPAHGDQIATGGKTYRIQRVIDIPDDKGLQLDLVGAFK